ncbi:hypothetical protein [Sphingobium sp. CECT 9361]|uniref:hypothetical protein n=1 Tax=Sphingobium sp. CECT 9361 TaxID=2845384 RepID=UPI001E28AB33|nr:hypothetical protein [Sphingobium sp. CECT 9361]
MGRKPQNSANLAAFLHIIDTSRLITVLQNDARAIVQAAAHAERAVAFLHKLADRDEEKNAA